MLINWDTMTNLGSITPMTKSSSKEILFYNVCNINIYTYINCHVSCEQGADKTTPSGQESKRGVANDKDEAAKGTH